MDDSGDFSEIQIASKSWEKAVESAKKVKTKRIYNIRQYFSVFII